MVILAVLFSPIAMYFKYEMVHQHLCEHGEATDLPGSGIGYLGISFSGIAAIFAITFFVRLGLSVFPILLIALLILAYVVVLIAFDYQWQNSMNHQIIAHGLV